MGQGHAMRAADEVLEQIEHGEKKNLPPEIILKNVKKTVKEIRVAAESGWY